MGQQTDPWMNEQYARITKLQEVCFEDGTQYQQISAVGTTGDTIGPATFLPRLDTDAATAPNEPTGTSHCNSCSLKHIFRKSTGEYFGMATGEVGLAFKLHDVEGRGNVISWRVELEFVGGDLTDLLAWQARDNARKQSLTQDLTTPWCVEANYTSSTTPDSTTSEAPSSTSPVTTQTPSTSLAQAPATSTTTAWLTSSVATTPAPVASGATSATVSSAIAATKMSSTSPHEIATTTSLSAVDLMTSGEMATTTSLSAVDLMTSGGATTSPAESDVSSTSQPWITTTPAPSASSVSYCDGSSQALPSSGVLQIPGSNNMVEVPPDFSFPPGSCLTFTAISASKISFQDPGMEPVLTEGIQVQLSVGMPSITLVFPTAAHNGRSTRRLLASCGSGKEIRVGEEQQTPRDVCGCSAYCMGDLVKCTVSASGTYAPVVVLSTACDAKAASDSDVRDKESTPWYRRYLWVIVGIAVGFVVLPFIVCCIFRSKWKVCHSEDEQKRLRRVELAIAGSLTRFPPKDPQRERAKDDSFALPQPAREFSAQDEAIASFNDMDLYDKGPEPRSGVTAHVVESTDFKARGNSHEVRGEVWSHQPSPLSQLKYLDLLERKQSLQLPKPIREWSAQPPNLAESEPGARMQTLSQPYLDPLAREQSLQLPQPMREWSWQPQNQTWIDEEKEIGVTGPGDTPQMTHMTASIVHSDQPDAGSNQVRQLSRRKSLLDMKPLPYKEPIARQDLPHHDP